MNLIIEIFVDKLVCSIAPLICTAGADISRYETADF